MKLSLALAPSPTPSSPTRPVPPAAVLADPDRRHCVWYVVAAPHPLPHAA